LDDFARFAERYGCRHTIRRAIKNGKEYRKKAGYATGAFCEPGPRITLTHHGSPYFIAEPDHFRVMVPRGSVTTMKRVRRACPYPIYGRLNGGIYSVEYVALRVRHFEVAVPW
jgi:hypothetical protein